MRTRKRTRKRRTFKRRGKKATFGRRIRRVIDRYTESKSFSNQYGLVSDYGGPPVAVCAVTPGQGAARNQRLGNNIRLAHFFLNLIASAANTTASRLRIIVFIDRSPTGGAGTTGVLPVTSNLFFDPTAGNWHYAMFNTNTVPTRYKVLTDKVLRIDVGGGATDEPLKYTFRRRYTMKDMLMQFNESNAASVADIQKNAVYVLAISDQTGATVPVVGIEVEARFKDA